MEEKEAMRFRESDTTTIYSSLLSVSSVDVARGLFRVDEGYMEGFEQGELFGHALKRVESIIKLALSLEPECTSAEKPPIIPWSPKSLSELNGKCWPKVLGRRIVIPHDASKAQKGYFVSNVLLNMSYL